MSSERIEDGEERFKQNTLDEILTAYLDTENPNREIKLKTAKASLSIADAVLGEAVRKFLRIRDLEGELDDCHKNPRSTPDQRIRDLSNKRARIRAKIKGNSALASKYKLVENSFASKLVKK